MELVLVEWVDAVYHDLWEPASDTDPIDMKVSSVGWLARKTDDYIQVIPHQQADQVRGGISIPAGAVRKIVNLNIPKVD